MDVLFILAHNNLIIINAKHANNNLLILKIKRYELSRM